MEKKAKTTKKRKKGFLVIVESPAKAKTIGRILGAEYTVKASMGHIRDLPSSKFGVDIEKNFEPQYILIRSKSKITKELKAAVAKAEKIYLATDHDREGEAIAWHLTFALATPPESTSRITFNEITPSAVKSAITNPSQIIQPLVNAQQARRLLDRIVGYKLSPLLWKKISGGLSAGRVQSVAVKIIVEREKEILAFKPEEYWEVEAQLTDPESGKAFTTHLKKLSGEEAKLVSKDQTDKVLAELPSHKFVVSKCESKSKNILPPPPFNTSLLQQQASTRLNFSTKKTMMIAQQLYEGIELGEEGPVGLITYMRTDSFFISNDAVKECRAFIEATFGNDALNPTERFYKSPKASQQAHEAIRPTTTSRTPDDMRKYLSSDQLRLYELVWRRFVATQMKPAIHITTTAEIAAGEALFTAQGRKIAQEGYTAVSKAGKEAEEQLLPPLTQGTELPMQKIDPSQHFTQPPPRFTEATMVKFLEKNGIGRPSTYAPIISTIQERGYVEKKNNALVPTELGTLVTDKLSLFFSDIMDTEFTSRMESKLDLVEEGKIEWQSVLSEFYTIFNTDLTKASENMISEKDKPSESEEKCDKCGKPMVVKWTKKGKFLACSGYPDCKTTKSINQEILEDKCDKCGAPLAVIRLRYGSFIGCTKYPDCKFTKPMNYIKDEEGKYIPITEVCDKCGKTMVLRFGKRGPFLACPGYPDCKNVRSIPRKPKQPSS